MKRREFLKTGTAGLAGMTLSGLSVGAAGASQLPKSAGAAADRGGSGLTAWKKGFMLGTFNPEPAREMSLLEQFRLLKEAGFDGVEPGSALDRDEVVSARDETGLEIPSVVVSTHWSQPLSDPDPKVRRAGLEGLQTALRNAKEYGASSVLLVPAVVNSDVSYDDAYRRSQAEIRKALPLAEELGVTIAIENVWNQFLLSPLEAATYIDEFESPRVGWHLDVGNVMNYGWPEQWVRILAKRIVMIHFKEFSRKKRDAEGLWRGFQVNLLEGDNDWQATMQALRDVGYSGYAIAEPPHRDPNLADDVWLKEYLADRMNKIFMM